MRIAVCDDMDFLRNGIVEKIKEHSYFQDAEIFEFKAGNELIENFEAGQYDIIFMDYFMKGLNGMETSKMIREVDQRLLLIFATTETGISLRQVNAAMRIDKPVKQEMLDRVAELYEQKRKEKDEDYLEFVGCGRKYSILKENISFCHGDVLNVRGRDIHLSGAISLEGEGYYTTKAEYQINIKHIKEVKMDKVILWTRQELPITFREWWYLRKIVLPIQEQLKQMSAGSGMIW